MTDSALLAVLLRGDRGCRSGRVWAGHSGAGDVRDRAPFRTSNTTRQGPTT